MNLYTIKSKTLDKLTKYSFWIQAVLTDSISSKALKFLKEIDRVCLELEKIDKNTEGLNQKIKSLSYGESKNYQSLDGASYISIKDLSIEEHERRRQIWDFFNELRACAFLFNKGYSDIEVIPRIKNKKTPDLKAKKEGQQYFIEVKTLNAPREEEDRLMGREMIVKNVDRGYAEPLESKVNYFIKDAELKFESVGAKNKILIIYYYLSISTYIVNGREENTLDKIIGKKYLSDGSDIIIINKLDKRPSK